MAAEGSVDRWRAFADAGPMLSSPQPPDATARSGQRH
jgi:hypothetical protein